MPLFARHAAYEHNRKVSSKYPQMHSIVQDLWVGEKHSQWVLHHDPSCETKSAPCEFKSWSVEQYHVWPY